MSFLAAVAATVTADAVVVVVDAAAAVVVVVMKAMHVKLVTASEGPAAVRRQTN